MSLPVRDNADCGIPLVPARIAAVPLMVTLTRSRFSVTLTKGLVTVAVTAVICGAVGMGLGLAIGRWAPDAYRAVFEHGGGPWRDRRLDPEQIGIGLGLAQGVLVGIAVGVLIVALVTWYEIRTLRGDH
jgi:hypothetical protein